MVLHLLWIPGLKMKQPKWKWSSNEIALCEFQINQK